MASIPMWFTKKTGQGRPLPLCIQGYLKTADVEAACLVNAKRRNVFPPEKYASKQKLFGVIVLESDQDLKPKTAYTCYENRWLLELVFKQYKNDEYLDHTGAQENFFVNGSAF